MTLNYLTSICDDQELHSLSRVQTQGWYLLRNDLQRLEVAERKKLLSHSQMDARSGSRLVDPLYLLGEIGSTRMQYGEGNGTPHSSTLAWKIPRTEEPVGLPSMGSHRVRHD